MRAVAAAFAFLALGSATAAAGCVGAPHDQFNFWLGDWRDPAAADGQTYSVRRTADGCAIEERLLESGAVRGISVSGWDATRHVWRQLWIDAKGAVTLYTGGPTADGTFVLTSETDAAGVRWRYTYRDITAEHVDAEYARTRSDGGPWDVVWNGRFTRIPAGR